MSNCMMHSYQHNQSAIYIIKMDIILLLWASLVCFVSSTTPVFYTSCAQSTTRTCSFGTNVTDRLLSLKKGGSNVLSTNNYDSTFYVCEEYNYNCGYSEGPYNFLTIANGMQLNLTYAQLLNIIPSDPTLANLIKPYLSVQGATVKCVSDAFPLVLTDSQSSTAMIGFLNRLASNLSTSYNANKASQSLIWSDVNINIKTAVIEMAKYNMNTNFLGSSFWNNFLANNWSYMSSELYTNHTNTNNSCPQCLRSAYLIDSVTVPCNKEQSINFLVDESGSIGASNFQYALQFLNIYVSQTLDNFDIMSIHFFDSSFDPYIDFGTTKAQMLTKISTKNYRSRGTYTGVAINASVAKIAAQNYPNGLPKLLVILTDGGSVDNVQYAADYARSLGITLFCVGIGANYNNAQLLQIAGTQSNILYISNYASLGKLAYIIANYFCKQIIDVKLNQPIYGNLVRVPSCPNYYRVQRSPIANQFYQLSLVYSNYIASIGEAVRESHYDPFPDNFSVYAQTENYQTNNNVRVYYISPQSPEKIPIKKTVTIQQTPTHAYISVAGTNMSFNISLTVCNTSNCTVERNTSATINQQYVQQQQQQQQQQAQQQMQSGQIPYNDNGGDNVPNPSIFIAIGTGLGLMGLCTFGLIYGARKFQEAPEEQPLNQLQNQVIQNQEQPEAPEAPEVPNEVNAQMQAQQAPPQGQM